MPRYGHGKLLSCWLSALILASSAMAATPGAVELSADRPAVEVGRRYQFLEDRGTSLTFEQVLLPSVQARFAPGKAAVYNPGPSRSAHWLRIALANTSAKDGDWQLVIRRPYLTEVAIYEPATAASPATARRKSVPGDPAGLEIHHRLFTYPVFLHTGEEKTFYIRYTCTRTTSIPLAVYTPAGFEAVSERDAWILILCYGALGVMLLYQPLVWASFRDPAYLYATGYIAGILITMTEIDGFSQMYLAAQKPFFDLIVTFLIELTSVFLVLFVRSSCETRKRVPDLDHVLLAVVGILALKGLLQALHWIPPLLPWSPLMILLVGVICLTTSITVWSKGYKPALYIGLALLIPVVALAMMTLDRLAIIPHYSLVEFTPVVAGLFQVLGMGFALNQRIRSIQSERHRGLQELVASLQARRNAEEMNAQLGDIIENSPDAVATFSAGGAVTYRNEAAQKLLDGTPTAALLRPEIMAAALRDGLWRGETQIVSADGTAIPGAQVVIAHKHAGGTVDFYSVVTRDLREHRQLEEHVHRVQKVETLGRFAGGIAHDFNNLLTVIQGYTELARVKLQDGVPARRNMDLVLNACTKAARLTGQLLAFSRHRAIDSSHLNLNTVVLDLSRILRRLIGAKIDLEFHLEPELHLVRGNATQMEQVLMNLAVNARDAMPDGGKLVFTTSNRSTGPNGTLPGPFVSLMVSDSGKGMPAGVLEKACEPFFTTKPVGEGTGLGLAVVDGIVKQYGGTVLLRSEPGQGTSVEIVLPEATDSEPFRQPPPEAVPASAASIPATILVVEDEEDVRYLMAKVLRDAGHRVFQAGDGEAGYQAIVMQKEGIDLLITDVLMPRMDGLQLSAKVRQEFPGIRILIVAAYEAELITAENLPQHGTEVLFKPFSPVTLALRVQEALRSSSSARPAGRTS